jgi:uncharacterized membrane protein YkvA (DUF1232 family)
MPVDAVPDFLVGIGYADDMAIWSAITAYGTYMDDASKARPGEGAEIFGNDVAV